MKIFVIFFSLAIVAHKCDQSWDLGPHVANWVKSSFIVVRTLEAWELIQKISDQSDDSFPLN